MYFLEHTDPQKYQIKIVNISIRSLKNFPWPFLNEQLRLITRKVAKQFSCRLLICIYLTSTLNILFKTQKPVIIKIHAQLIQLSCLKMNPKLHFLEVKIICYLSSKTQLKIKSKINRKNSTQTRKVPYCLKKTKYCFKIRLMKHQKS